MELLRLNNFYNRFFYTEKVNRVVGRERWRVGKKDRKLQRNADDGTPVSC